MRERHDGEAFRQRYGLQGKLIVSHSGNMGVKQGLEVILEAAARSRQRPDLHYLFVGDGAMRPQLEEQARVRQLANVQFLPLLPAEEFQQMLAATGIALITQQRIVSNIVFPSKTVTLLCAGCPVIAAVNSESEVARAVLNSQAGVVVEPENADALFARHRSAFQQPGDTGPHEPAGAPVCQRNLGRAPHPAPHGGAAHPMRRALAEKWGELEGAPYLP